MRRRQAVSVEQLLQEPYLDAEEQEEVVRSLKQQHAKQSRHWTIVFALLAVGLGVGCMYLSWHQIRDPWGLRHHAYFSGSVNSKIVAFVEACSGISLLLSAGALQTADPSGNCPLRSQWPHQALLMTSIISAVLTGFSWLCLGVKAAHFQDESFYHMFHYAWLPGVPIAYVVLVYYLLHSFGGTAQDFALLRSSMYNFHTA